MLLHSLCSKIEGTLPEINTKALDRALSLSKVSVWHATLIHMGAKMILTESQKIDFRENGYLKIPGAVPKVMVDRVLHAINHSLGEEGMNKEDLPTLRAQSYCREICEHEAVTDLLNASPVLTFAEQLIGAGKINKATGGQIALRFPRPLGEDPPPPRGHLDGLGSGLNGSAKGTYQRRFTALAVILLNQLDEPYCGNFTVWPKSHTFFEDHFKQNGVEVLENGMPRLELPEEPVQITGSPGDVVITHHQLVHTAAPNASPHVRYAAIFRLRHVDCEEFGNKAYTDIWHEWPGIRELV